MNPVGRRRHLTVGAVLIVMFATVFVNVEPVRSEGTAIVPAGGGGQTTDETGGYGDTEDPVYIPQHAVFVPDQDVELVPCADIDEHDNRVPREICDTFAAGYSKGVKVYDHYDNQRVCFSVVGPSPQPTQYLITPIEIYPGIMTPTTSRQLYGRYPAKTDEALSAAISTYNLTSAATDINTPRSDHANFKVATIDNYTPTGGFSSAWEWPYSLYQGNGNPPPTRPASYMRHIRPVAHDWREDILGYKKDVYFYFEWNWTITGWNYQTQCTQVWNPDHGPIDPITGLPTGDWETICNQVPGPDQTTSRRTTALHSRTSRTISTTSPTLTAGRPASVYADNMKTQVRDLILDPPPVTVQQPACPYDTCTRINLVSDNVRTFPLAPYAVTAGALHQALPAFWQVWELWGDRFKTETDTQKNKQVLIKLKEGDDGDTGPRGIGWIDLKNDYKIDYYDCYTTRNGGYIRRWQVAVPYPRKSLTHTDLTPSTASEALVKTPVVSPHPQSISGMFTDLRASNPPASNSAPPVHVPVPIFDIGSGVLNSPTAPDGNWWAVARSIPGTYNTGTSSWEYPDCVDVGGIPVCLAEAYRPWRAIWYIEPPPYDPTDPTPPDPTPKDVRVCAYSTSSTTGLLTDEPREQTNTTSTYHVVVDTMLADNAAMMHTLQTLNSDPGTQPTLKAWLEDWLYGQGTNLARAYGQDQTNAARYCWYKWYQAHNTTDGADGYRGVLAVEWLTTFYLGVPENPKWYCLDGTHTGMEDNVGTEPQNSRTDYQCSTSMDYRSDAAHRWFRMSAADWTAPGRPSFTMEFMDRSVSRVSQCYVGKRTIEGMSEPFQWYLQAAAILYDNNQDPTTHEPMHPLGGGRTPATTATDTAPSSTWWREGLTPRSSLPRVATPQNLATTLASNDPDRLYMNSVTPLRYPTALSDTSGHEDCNQIPVWTIGIPCNQWAQSGSNRGQCTGKEWFSLFGENPGIPPSDIAGQLWAWWAQQISELRHNAFPVPVDP